MSAITLFVNHVLIAFIIGLDQWCKFIIKNNHYSADLFGLLSIRQTWNQGISFGVFDNLYYGNSLFLVVGSIMLAHLYPFFLRIRVYWSSMIWAMIIGGAASNLTDRVLYGAVLDFIGLHVGKYYFPVFNLADVAITTGALMLLWRTLLGIKRGR